MRNAERNVHKLESLKISAIAITSVVLVETILGLAVGSLAILSDGAHALLDALTIFILLIAAKESLKPADEEHMYGHEKIEFIGGLIGGIILLGLAFFLLYESTLRFFVAESYLVLELEFAGFIAIGYTFCVDILRVGILHKAESEGVTLKAGFYHAIADLGSTVIALLGFGLATLGFHLGDALASMILSLVITYLSIKLIWSSGMELTDAVSKDVAKHVKKAILCTKGVCECEDLRVRTVGTKNFVEATVKVPEYMSLEDAHALASKIEANIKGCLENADITIHIEPLNTTMQTEKLVEHLAAEVEGVKEIHGINMAYTSGKLYITLHARVDPKLSVHEAHAIAEKIERKINERISEVENVTVHVEPFKAKVQKGSEADEKEVRQIVEKALKDFPEALQCKKIVTYVADNRRYINIDCSFTSQITIKDAHKIASQIERSIRKNFAETIVTVHVEPD